MCQYITSLVKKNRKKCLSPQKFVDNVGREEKFVVKIDGEFVAEKKTANGNVHRREGMQQKKNISVLQQNI